MLLIPISRLAEVGKLQPVLGKYECGQLFLHRVFGYRGVILFPWLARVYDRDQYTIKSNDPQPKDEDMKPPNVGNAETAAADSSASRGKTNTFYQVLIDARDCPYIVRRSMYHVCCDYSPEPVFRSSAPRLRQ